LSAAIANARPDCRRLGWTALIARNHLRPHVGLAYFGLWDRCHKPLAPACACLSRFRLYDGNVRSANNADVSAIRRGRKDEVRQMFKGILGRHTAFEPLTEDIHPETEVLRRNFPQAYSIAGTINTATRLPSRWEKPWARV
jgi:hypothetical protein